MARIYEPLNDEAKAYIQSNPRLKLDNYFFGSVCKNGHNFPGTERSIRREENGSCIHCLRERAEQWRKEKPEEVKESRDRHRRENIDILRLRQRERYANNVLGRKDRAKQAWLKKKEELKTLYEQHPELKQEQLARHRDYYRRNKGRYKNYSKRKILRRLAAITNKQAVS